MSLDLEGFDSAMDAQRARSRSVTTFASISDAYKKLSARGFKPEFRGYEMLAADSKVSREYTALAQAAGRVATPHVRDMGTIGGNIAQSKAPL